MLEIGYGLGYSADRIQSYHPRLHTIIECNPVVLLRCREWAKGRHNVRIVASTWQEALGRTPASSSSIGQFDVIFFDDFGGMGENVGEVSASRSQGKAALTAAQKATTMPRPYCVRLG